MRAKLLGILITLFWVTMMCSLVMQHILPERRRAKSLLVEPEILASQWIDIHEWSWIRNNNKDVGAMVLSVIQVKGEQEKSESTYRVIQNGEATIPILFTNQRVQFMLTMELTPEFNVSKFIVQVNVPLLQVESLGFVLDENLFYRIRALQPDPVYGVYTLQQPLSLLAAIRPMISRQLDLVVGKTYPVDVIDPINAIGSGQAHVKVAAMETIQQEGKPVSAYRLETTLGSITKRSWVSKYGVTLRRELFKGYMMEQGEKRDIIARYPNLRNSLQIPAIDAGEFIRKSREQQQTAQPSISPDTLKMLGEMIGGD